MKFRKQRHKLPIDNIDKIVSSRGGNIKYRHSPLLPNTIRSIVCGSSGCGKTNVVMTLLISNNGLRYKNIYIFSKSLYQPKYQYLMGIMKKIPEIGFFTFSENEQVIPPEKVRPHSIMIFDDVIQENQKIIESYFTRGRHNLIDCFYLSQSYFQTPRRLIRNNCNFLIIFNQTGKDIRNIYNDHVINDMSFDDFNNICSEAWNKNKYGFIVIDKERELNNGRYRIGMDTFVMDIVQR